MLDVAQMDLLAALPPVVTGIGNALESWENSKINAMAAEELRPIGDGGGGEGEGRKSPSTPSVTKRGEENRPSPGPDVGGMLHSGDDMGASTKQVVDENAVTWNTSELGSGHARSVLLRDVAESASGIVSLSEENGRKVYGDDMSISMSSSQRVQAAASSAVDGGTPRVWGADTRASAAGKPETAAAAEAAARNRFENDNKRRDTVTLRRGVGAARLCRRAVILLTRSPACPDLVKRQTGSADQKTYDQMEPLLEKAGMSYKDLHPTAAVSVSTCMRVVISKERERNITAPLVQGTKSDCSFFGIADVARPRKFRPTKGAAAARSAVTIEEPLLDMPLSSLASVTLMPNKLRSGSANAAGIQQNRPSFISDRSLAALVPNGIS